MDDVYVRREQHILGVRMIYVFSVRQSSENRCMIETRAIDSSAEIELASSVAHHEGWYEIIRHCPQGHVKGIVGIVPVASSMDIVSNRTSGTTK